MTASGYHKVNIKNRVCLTTFGARGRMGHVLCVLYPLVSETWYTWDKCSTFAILPFFPLSEVSVVFILMVKPCRFKH